MASHPSKNSQEELDTPSTRSSIDHGISSAGATASPSYRKLPSSSSLPSSMSFPTLDLRSAFESPEIPASSSGGTLSSRPSLASGISFADSTRRGGGRAGRPSISCLSSASSVGSGISPETAYRFMANTLLKTAVTRGWTNELDLGVVSAVALRLGKMEGRNVFIIAPQDDPRLASFEAALDFLNPECCFTLTSPAVKTITDHLPPDVDTVVLSSSLRIQVFDSWEELAHARPAQMACFVRQASTLVLWFDNAFEFATKTQQWEDRLVEHVWLQATGTLLAATQIPSGDLVIVVESPEDSQTSVESPEDFRGSTQLSDEEKSICSTIERSEGPRPVLYYNTVYVGISVGLDFFVCSLLVRTIFEECLVDGTYTRLAILVVLPFMFLVIMFVADTIVGIIAQLVMPIKYLQSNSLYYSGLPPVQLTTPSLPHVTIMMPVYKEDLEEVLAPTIESVSAAIRTYELQGGTANLLVSEDGLQLFDEKEVLKRRDYYERWNCAWVARSPDKRVGRFKKSSNLNNTHALSLRIEELMDGKRPVDAAFWSQREEDVIYHKSLEEALAEQGGRTWAHGNVRIGDYILLIDSDTRIPDDCFLDAVSEMEASPDVAILQHCSGTFLAGAGIFENGIAFFTKIVNFSISWTVAQGASAPFMGHNAFLRWSALQHQALSNENGAVWSEDHVSEDFVMTLNLLKAGYIVRWATYTNSLLLEGVSLTCDDELNRWQKYAFGCSEMVFNPMRFWFTKSPFSKLYRNFLWSPAPLASKFTTTSYIASYWAIAAGTPLTFGLYVVQGLLWDDIDHRIFIAPFSILLACIVIFSGGGTIGLIAARYRSGDMRLWSAIWQHVSWMLFFTVFFSGLSWHCFTALCAHITGYNMTWSSTVKSFTTSTVFQEIPRTVRKFRITYAVMFTFLAGVIVLMTPALPIQWRITDIDIAFTPIWFSAFHILFPILLNPWVMLWRF